MSWIKPEDRLPEMYEQVFVHVSDGDTYCGVCRTLDDDGHWIWSRPLDGEVLYWHPIEWPEEPDTMQDVITKRYNFLINQFQMHSPDMGGQHSYRFRNSGWPMQHFKGSSIEIAIDNAIEAIKKEE